MNSEEEITNIAEEKKPVDDDEYDKNNHSYGSINNTENLDISNIKSYFKHRKGFKWSNVKNELWNQKILLLVVFLLEIFLLIIGLLEESWRDMSWQAWTSIEVTIVTLYLLIANTFPPAFIFLAAMSFVYGLNIVDSDEAFEGFSNTGVLTVGVLVSYFLQFLKQQKRTCHTN